MDFAKHFANMFLLLAIFAPGVFGAYVFGENFENKDVTAIAAGETHSMLLKKDGTVWATGENYQGQIGDGTLTWRWTFMKVVLAGAYAISAGGWHSLVLQTDGTVWATGWNEYGQLGDGTLTNKLSFVQVISDAKAIAGGKTHSMVLKTDGSLWATGANDFGTLGDGSQKNSKVFKKVMSTDVTAIAGGETHSMLLKKEGSLWVAGYNREGQFGDGTTTKQLSFKKVTKDQCCTKDVQAIAAGEVHSIMMKKDGTVWTTGLNRNGQLGDGTRTNRLKFVKASIKGQSQTTPKPGTATSGQAIAAGEEHSMWLHADGSVWAAGGNTWGQLGDGTNIDSLTFVKVLPSGAKAIAAGRRHSMVLTKSGIVWATGYNREGQFGDRSVANSYSLKPVGSDATTSTMATAVTLSLVVMIAGLF